MGKLNIGIQNYEQGQRGGCNTYSNRLEHYLNQWFYKIIYKMKMENI